MSRSMRKTPIVKDHNKGQKKIANRRVRRVLQNIGEEYWTPALYKRVYCSWEISDYAFWVDANSKYLRK